MKEATNDISRIADYYKRIADLTTAGGTANETSIRKAFLELVDKFARENQLTIVDELIQFGTKNRPDAGLQSAMGLNYGYIENKDRADNIESEIAKKIERGYDLTNIIFENSQWLVLYQAKSRIAKIYIGKDDLTNKRASNSQFASIIKQFINYEPPFISEFTTALAKFKEQVPDISQKLTKLIAEQNIDNREFKAKVKVFLGDCAFAINKEVHFDDVSDMIVQHILTKDIFDSTFENQQFHKYNSIAKSIEDITSTFFTQEKEMELTKSIRSYYQAIIRSAKSIDDHRQKQNFLKTVYQEFYKAHNPAKADRQGIEYTPIEVVSFMIEMTNLLLFRHFQQKLDDKGVEILDPCTGTGIFISELLYQISHSNNFDLKFENEIFCNEIDILPYYVANLNIEYIRAQIKGNYKTFNNIVLADTLNNTNSLNLGSSYNDMKDIFSQENRHAFNENNQKIKKQNEAKLKVIIGNPPYNANQKSENSNNKNFTYIDIDKRIKETYIKKSSAQKTKQFDLYKRFIRWASDRMDEEKGGIIAFITNNSYLDSKQDDGFRACIAEEFDYGYFVNLKGNSRLNGEEAKKQGENIFNIRVGCGIMFLVKNGDNILDGKSSNKTIKRRCEIKYIEAIDCQKKEEKLAFLNEMMVKIANNVTLRTYKELIGNFTKITPSAKHQWLGQVKNNWQELPALINKEVKNSNNLSQIQETAIFKLYSLGVATNRDKWVYDINKKNLEKKVKKFIEIYHQELERNNQQIDKLQKLKKSEEGKTNEGFGLTKYFLEHRKWEYSLKLDIKWSENLKNYLKRKKKLKFKKSLIAKTAYRPFVKKYLYYANGFNDRPSLFKKIFANKREKEKMICFDTRANHCAVISDCIVDLHTNGDSLAIPLNYYEENGSKNANITEFGRKIFTEKYGEISDEQIFYYCCAVLGSKKYSEQYRENLKLDLPRIPLLENFWQLSDCGKQLANLHLNYETAEKYPLKLVAILQRKISQANKEVLKQDFKPRVYLKINQEKGEIKLDDFHLITGIPKEAFDYKIGNKSPLEWICTENCFAPPKYNLQEPNEQILEEIDEYNWQEVKEHLIDLVPRLVTTSLESQRILQEIDKLFDQ